MGNGCRIDNCNGNHNEANKCRIFKLPKDEKERQKWINVIPPRTDYVINPTTFHICERHWPDDTPMVKVPGGHTRPVLPPSMFDVPLSRMPTPKPTPRKDPVEDRQLNYFLEKDTITAFSKFSPDNELRKKYENIIISRSKDTFLCIFMADDYSESSLSILVKNKSTLCSPLTFVAFKNGIKVPLGKRLSPNNGLSSYSQFFEAVHSVINYDPPVTDVVSKMVATLKQIQDHESLDDIKGKKLKFLSRQLELLCSKKYTVSDYCFAIESFPRCNYDQLRDVLILPCKRKLQSFISSTDVDQVLEKTFKKVQNIQQKQCFLIVDEVKIRPTVAYSGGVLSGMSKNDPNSKATSMLGVMMKCLHGGPSVMVSITPVHNPTGSYQFSVVKENAAIVENAGGVVVGSITDNHKINQHYCKLFTRKSDFEAVHPLNPERPWFLLYDSVHLLKCIRNNWISEKCQKLSLDGKTIGSFSDVRALYESEKNNILKTTSLTFASVYPSRLQLQNVQHVLKVFNDKVVAALRLQGAYDTASFIQQVLDWWNVVNVSAKGQDIRLRDPNRSVQDEKATNLHSLLDLMKTSQSGHGPKRIMCLTHDTRKALVQTTEGLIAVCAHLFSVGFEYVLLREIQSDRIEGEFSVYRQSTGANAFMLVGDVLSAFKRRLTRFAASFLEYIETGPSSGSSVSHTCSGIRYDDATAIENCISEVTLSAMEEYSVAYVAGWLEKQCNDLFFSEDEPLLSSGAKCFIEEVSRGYLTVPHVCTYELVGIGLRFVKMSKHQTCCRQKLVDVLLTISNFYSCGAPSKNLLRRLANVLLHGIHKLEKDHQKHATLYQTSIKKARLAE